MNMHSMIDKISLNTAAALSKKTRYFSVNGESRKLTDIEVFIDGWDGDFKTGQLNKLRGKADNIEINPAVFIAQWNGMDKPWIIYHHGAAEGKFDRSFKMIFNKKFLEENDYNVAAVQAPFSENNTDFIRNIKMLDRYTALIAGSAAAVEALIQKIKEKNISSEIYVTGTSLGGIVCCFHKLKYNSATAWIPLYAGPQVGEVFTESAYSVMCDENIKLRESENLKSILDFGDEFKQRDDLNDVYPLLGRYDLIFDFKRNVGYYKRVNVCTAKKGHSTGASSASELRTHISEIVKASAAAKAE